MINERSTRFGIKQELEQRMGYWESGWTGQEIKRKYWQNRGKWWSVTGTQGGKGKEHMYGVDDSSESEYWTQSASAASEEDLDF